MALRTLKSHSLTNCRLYFGNCSLKELKEKVFTKDHKELKGMGIRSFSELTGGLLKPLGLVIKVNFGHNNRHYLSAKSLARLIIRHGFVTYFSEHNLINRAFTYEEKLDFIFSSPKLQNAIHQQNVKVEEVLEGFLKLYKNKKPKNISQFEHFHSCFETMIERVENYLREPEKIQICA